MISDDVFRQKVIDLHPEANEFDELPPMEEDPPTSDCLQPTNYDVRNNIWGLPRNSSKGTTGSTYIFFMKVTEDRNQTTNEDDPPHEIFGAFAVFFNKVLKGGFINSGICSMLIFRKKLVLTPKQDGGLKPIAVMDALAKDMSMIKVHAKRYDGYTTAIISQAFTLPDLAGHLNININNTNNFHNDTVTMEKLIFLPCKQGGVGTTKHNGITTENSITMNLIKYRQ
jgi:hypothetical protein